MTINFSSVVSLDSAKLHSQLNTSDLYSHNTVYDCVLSLYDAMVYYIYR